MVPLSRRARVDVTRKARDYITALVARYRGNSEEVRSVIQDLHDQNNSASGADDLPGSPPAPSAGHRAVVDVVG